MVVARKKTQDSGYGLSHRKSVEDGDIDLANLTPRYTPIHVRGQAAQGTEVGLDAIHHGYMSGA